MNYADEATRFLDEANEAERAARWRSEDLESVARESVIQRPWPAGTKPEKLERIIANEHRRLKDNDHEGYKKHVSTNQWMLQKTIANGILAMVHKHVPTDQYDRARSK